MSDELIKKYYVEWKYAEKWGNKKYAEDCKVEYVRLVKEKIIKPYHFYIERFKMLPTIILN